MVAGGIKNDISDGLKFAYASILLLIEFVVIFFQTRKSMAW